MRNLLLDWKFKGLDKKRHHVSYVFVLVHLEIAQPPNLEGCRALILEVKPH